MKKTVTHPSDTFHQWMTLTLSNIKLQLIKLTGHSLNQVWVIIPTRQIYTSAACNNRNNTELKTIAALFAHPSGSLEDTSWVSLDPCNSLSIFSSDFVIFNKCCIHIWEGKRHFQHQDFFSLQRLITPNALTLDLQPISAIMIYHL